MKYSTHYITFTYNKFVYFMYVHSLFLNDFTDLEKLPDFKVDQLMNIPLDIHV